MRVPSHVTMAEGRRRALCWLAERPDEHYPPSWIGQAIWPDSGLRAQGLAFAAQRIIRTLVDDGFIRYGDSGRYCTHRDKSTSPVYGYTITRAGLRALPGMRTEYATN